MLRRILDTEPASREPILRPIDHLLTLPAMTFNAVHADHHTSERLKIAYFLLIHMKRDSMDVISGLDLQ